MALGPLSRRPGVNRANAYPLLGAHDLRDGLASYDTRSCTNPTPRVSSAPSPELDQTTRDQLAQYVYVPDPDHVAAPPCKAQGPVPGFGTSFPVLAADPPTGP
jgi:hypothetical protein